MRISRLTILPFDSCFERNLHHEAVFRQLKLFRLNHNHWDERITGDSLDAWQTNEGWRIAISASGLGVALDQRIFELDLADSDNVARILIERAQLHKSIHDRSHQLCKMARSYNVSLKLLCRTRAHARLSRDDIFEGPPYAFTFYVINTSQAELVSSEGGKRALSALLEPSQVRCWTMRGHTGSALLPFREISDTIAALDANQVLNEVKDIDLQATTSALSTWASLVVLTTDDLAVTTRFYESVQIRLQLAWIASFLTRRWSESLLKDRSRSVESLERSAMNLDPLIRLARRSLDARTSSRSQNVMDGLVVTSELNREIDTAEELLRALSQRREYEMNVVRRKYNSVVEVVLFLLAATQLVPLISKTPLVTLPTPIVVVVLIGLLLLILIRFRR